MNPREINSKTVVIELDGRKRIKAFVIIVRIVNDKCYVSSFGDNIMQGVNVVFSVEKKDFNRSFFVDSSEIKNKRIFDYIFNKLS